MEEIGLRLLERTYELGLGLFTLLRLWAGEQLVELGLCFLAGAWELGLRFLNHCLRTAFGRRDPGKFRARLLEELRARGGGFLKCLAPGRGAAVGRFKIKTFRRSLGVRLRFFYTTAALGGSAAGRIRAMRSCRSLGVRPKIFESLSYHNLWEESSWQI